MARYVLTVNGHGTLVRPIFTASATGHQIAVVRTSTGAWVSGEVVRVWNSKADAERDHYSPEQRFQKLRWSN